MKIYCHGCSCYCGDIKQANIMKGLKYLCPKCDSKKKESNEGFDFLKDLFCKEKG